MKNKFYLLSIAIMLSFSVFEVQASTSEVTKSGSTWTTKVDGSTVYSGTDMIDALNAACSNNGSGTINVRSSGDADAPDGLRSVAIQSNQTIDFHGYTMNCNDALNIYPVKGTNKSNVAVTNLNITGVPRYLLHFSGCSGVTLSNITATTTRGTGIRVETSSDLVISGTINLSTPGHCIETYTVDGVDIGTVTVESSSGCGVLFNDSEDCNVDAIYAYNCSPTGTYAGFRQANDNGTTYCGYLYAENCGRGLYVITSSHGTTVDYVDIVNCYSSGISVTGTAYNVRVNGGTVSSDTPKQVDLWDGYSDVCIYVNSTYYGDACSSTGTYYNIANRNSGLSLDVLDYSYDDGADIIQYDYWGGECQQWQKVDAGDGYYYLKAAHSGKCMRASGGNVYQYTCYDGYWSEMFSLVDAGSGYYLIKNRNTNTCLRPSGGSTSAAASIVLEDCNTSYWSEMFSFTSVKSAETIEEPVASDMEDDCTIYPTTVDNLLNIVFSNGLEQGALFTLYDNTGKLMLSKNLYNEFNNVNLTNLSPGIYFVKISNNNDVVNQVIVKR